MNKFIKIFKISPIIALNKLFIKAAKPFANFFEFKRSLKKITYHKRPFWFKSINYHTIPIPEINNLLHFTEQIKTVAALVANKQFDLLGSGITKVTLNSDYKGILDVKYSIKRPNNIKEIINSYRNQKNQLYAYELLEKVDENFEYIDWQVDFKSGYRWNETEFSQIIKYGNVLGADIKVPWELGRMQYLIILAYAYQLFTFEKQINRAKHYTDVFKNILLDFRISNPPKFGVQWISPMDVAIRALNILVAYSFFKQAGEKFDDDFENFLFDLLFEHIDFVKNNPEWNAGLRGNHYLACISSLLIISTYLPISDYTKNIFSKSLKSLIKELSYQFYKDGGNFEGSLPYHRFAAEMVFYAIFCALSIPKSRFELFENFKDENLKIKSDSIYLSDKIIFKLFNIFEFLLFNSTRSHYFAQFGDNDGGYYLHLTPFYIKYLAKKINNYDYLFHSSNNPWNAISLFAGFFHDLIGNKIFERYNEYSLGKILRDKSNIIFDINRVNDKILLINKFITDKNSDELYKGKFFSNSGICTIWRNKYHFIFSIGEIGQKGKGGHNHSDSLSFELFIENVPVIVNSGTFCYTPFPKIRNQYRSIKSHNTIVYEGYEQNIFNEKSKDDMFWVEKHSAKGKIIKFTDNCIIGEHYAFGKPCRRVITFEDEIIDFNDFCKILGEKKIYLHFFPGVQIFNKDEYVICDYRHIKLKIFGDDLNFKTDFYKYSLNYGLLQEAECLIISSEKENVNWKIKIY